MANRPPVKAIGGPSTPNPSKGDPTMINSSDIATATVPQRVCNLSAEYNIIPHKITTKPNMVGRAASGTIGGLNVSGRAIESSKLPPKSERIEGILNLPEASKGNQTGSHSQNLKIICVRMRANKIVRGRMQRTSIPLGMSKFRVEP